MNRYLYSIFFRSSKVRYKISLRFFGTPVFYVLFSVDYTVIMTVLVNALCLSIIVFGNIEYVGYRTVAGQKMHEFYVYQAFRNNCFT